MGDENRVAEAKQLLVEFMAMRNKLVSLFQPFLIAANASTPDDPGGLVYSNGQVVLARAPRRQDLMLLYADGCAALNIRPDISFK